MNDPVRAPVALRGPAHAVALVPHLLGFQPDDSLVAIWARDGHLVLTQRVDLPPLSVDMRDFAREFVDLGRHAAASSALVLVYAAEQRPGLGTAVAAALDERGVEVLDVLLVDGRRFRSELCDGDCCPDDGREVPMAILDEVRAAFALDGRATLDSRAALVDSLSRDDDAHDRLAPLTQIDHPTGDLEQWRDASIEDVLSALECGLRIDDTGMAVVVTRLDDVIVRDVVTWALSRRDDPRVEIDALVACLRVAPAGLVAPVATTLAMTCWLCGDGARATVALQRALQDDPDYTLARLIGQAVSAGLPPDGWRRALASMTMADLRLRRPAA